MSDISTKPGVPPLSQRNLQQRRLLVDSINGSRKLTLVRFRKADPPGMLDDGVHGGLRGAG